MTTYESSVRGSPECSRTTSVTVLSSNLYFCKKGLVILLPSSMDKKRMSVRACLVVRKERAIQIGGFMSFHYAYNIARKFRMDWEAHYSHLPRVAVKRKFLSTGSLQLPDVFVMFHFEGKC